MENQQSKQWLPLAWKIMAAYGFFNIFLSILVPFYSYFVLPNQPMMVYGSVDEKLTGLSWEKIMSFNPDLGLWMVLSMVSMCAMMIIGGVLTFMIAKHAYRDGKRWAWRALVAANVPSFAYYAFFIGGIHVALGLPFWATTPGSSGFGADWVLIITVVWVFIGLWLPRKELTD